MVGDRHVQSVVLDARVHDDAPVGGEYCAAFSSRCDRATDARRGSISTSRSASASTRTSRPSSACLTCAMAASTTSAAVTHWRSTRMAAASIRAMSRMSWKRRVRRSSSVIAAPACARRSSAGRSPRRFSTATRIAVSGVRRSWLSEASSVAARSAFCRTSSAASRSPRNCARSIAIATTPATASSVPMSRPAWPPRQQPTARVPCRSGTSDTSLLGADARVPAVGALTGVELERAPRPAPARRSACCVSSADLVGCRPGGSASRDRPAGRPPPPAARSGARRAAPARRGRWPSRSSAARRA